MAKKLSEQELFKVSSERQMIVAKGNSMIQKGRHDLSLQEQRAVLYAISKIKPTDDIFQEYQFEIKDFYKICGLADGNYTDLKKILGGLKSKFWWVETAPGEESTVSWFNKVRTNKGKGTVTIRFDDDMMPYLLHLVGSDSFYTQYNLEMILPMKSQYSPRLYELLKSYQKNNKEWFFEIDDLKRSMNCQNYIRFPDFRRYVLEPAVEEINKYTDINIAYDTEKQGRRVSRVIFYMANKGKQALIRAKMNRSDELDGREAFDERIEKALDPNSVRNKFFSENKED